jgi:hypothetical protein
VFDPNEMLFDVNGNPLLDSTGNPYRKYVFDPGAKKRDEQCVLDPMGDPENWKPCEDSWAKRDVIWWDVHPTPSGRIATNANGQQINDSNGKPIIIPGYFRMRSRFVDYQGTYVLHCHILAHEDRGMMTIVEVRPAQPSMKHH